MSPEQYAIYLAGVLAKKQAPPREPLVPRPSSCEADLHDAILAECRRRDLRVIHSRMDRASTVAIGAPDFVVALPLGRTLWLECKSAKGTLRPGQAAWLARLLDLNHEAHVVRSIEEFITIIKSPEPC